MADVDDSHVKDCTGLSLQLCPRCHPGLQGSDGEVPKIPGQSFCFGQVFWPSGIGNSPDLIKACTTASFEGSLCREHFQ